VALARREVASTVRASLHTERFRFGAFFLSRGIVRGISSPLEVHQADRYCAIASASVPLGIRLSRSAGSVLVHSSLTVKLSLALLNKARNAQVRCSRVGVGVGACSRGRRQLEQA
jgi:hypothetical protein